MGARSKTARPGAQRAFVVFFAAVIMAVMTDAPARAGSLPSPKGEVLLAVTGQIGNANVDGEAHFDRAMLEDLGITRVVTGTPWHEPGTVFEGISAARLMAIVEPRGNTLLATAANDYHVSIPVSDLDRYSVLLALTVDGRDLTLRTKGPIWVIYPDKTDLAPQARAERMIWQLVELEVR